MPSRNIRKIYVEKGYYHVYNRGVAKQKIFRDNQDYHVFIRQLAQALSTPVEIKTQFSLRGRTFKAVVRQSKNFNQQISLVSYCLMPNHYHFLIQQHTKESMTSFLRSITNRYVKYFNKKYSRVGPLFQGKYKAAIISDDRYLLHLSRYIHLNPWEHLENLLDGYSSYAEHLGMRKTEWVKPDIILKFFNSSTSPEFKKVKDYKSFVENSLLNSEKILGDLTLE